MSYRHCPVTLVQYTHFNIHHLDLGAHHSDVYFSQENQMLAHSSHPTIPQVTLVLETYVSILKGGSTQASASIIKVIRPARRERIWEDYNKYLKLIKVHFC